ncbi:MAG TPA: glycosyltransferase family 4 protein [Syntrophomonadaceae bacterium]|nr:glycosyltransferase family 4 protein [Syntrophomonadaceae bacterium]
MKIALLAPIAWRTPPRHYGPWESIVSLLTEGLVEKGLDVTLFATADSISRARLEAICPRPYEEDKQMDAKVWECLHIAHLFEQADAFDLIHNHYDFLPLSYSRLVSTPLLTTIHGFSSEQILPVYRKYNSSSDYVSISYADRSPELDYIANVYHGIDLNQFTYQEEADDYLLFFGRIHPDKGTREAIQIAQQCKRRLIIAGIIQDQSYYEKQIRPHIDETEIIYYGPAGPDERNRLLGGALALLHPISFAEPFGLSVIEAMACGTPVIAFRKGSMPEVIAEGRSGYLVQNVGEAVEAVQDISRIQRWQCRRWVEENFSSNRMVADYIAVYQKII